MIQGYLTTSEAAKILEVTDARIRQLILDEDIKATKVGNTLVIRLSVLERFQQKRNGKRKKKAA